MVYTPVSDIILFFSQSQKAFRLSIKDINKPLLLAKFQTDWFETVEKIGAIQNRYPIAVYGVLSDSE